MKRPIGIVNRNPLNIRYSPMNTWRGQSGSYKGFCVFNSLVFGYRAALVLLSNYIKRGHVSISAIVSRWAPATENDTKAYIRTVIEHFNGYDDSLYKSLTADTDLTTFPAEDLYSIMFELAWIMSLVECGYRKGFDYKDERKGIVESMHVALTDAVNMVVEEHVSKSDRNPQ